MKLGEVLLLGEEIYSEYQQVKASMLNVPVQLPPIKGVRLEGSEWTVEVKLTKTKAKH